MLLEELKDAFLYSRKQGTPPARRAATPETLAMYDKNLTILNTFLQGRKSRTRYEDVIAKDIREYIEYVNGHPTWALATKLQRKRVLRSLFHFIDVDEECSGLKSFHKLIGVITECPSKEFVPSAKEMRDFRSAFSTTTRYGLRNYVVFSLILGTGMRVSEVCWLRLEHLALDQNLITVPKEGKTGTRVVPVETKLVELLRTWLRKRRLIKGHDTEPWVFLAKTGGRCTRNTFRLAFRRARQVVKDTTGKDVPITPHTGRHAFGTYYLENDGNMERLRRIMGHTSYRTLQKYLHRSQVSGAKALTELEKSSPLRMVNSTR